MKLPVVAWLSNGQVPVKFYDFHSKWSPFPLPTVTVITLLAAPIYNLRSPGSDSEKVAGNQLHRQRAGTVLGPTVLAKRAPKDIQSLQRCITTLRNTQFLKSLVSGGRKTSTAQADLKAWTQDFLRVFNLPGAETEDSYVGKHLVRKVLLWQTLVGNTKKPLPPLGTPEDVAQALSCIDSSFWLPSGISRAQLLQLAPDQCDFIMKCPTALSPRHIRALMGGVDFLMISCWTCLVHEAVKNFEQLGWDEFQILSTLKSQARALRDSARNHLAQHSDSGVPVAICPARLLAPLAKPHMDNPDGNLASQEVILSSAGTSPAADSSQQAEAAVAPGADGDGNGSGKLRSMLEQHVPTGAQTARAKSGAARDAAEPVSGPVRIRRAQAQKRPPVPAQAAAKRLKGAARAAVAVSAKTTATPKAAAKAAAVAAAPGKRQKHGDSEVKLARRQRHQPGKKMCELGLPVGAVCNVWMLARCEQMHGKQSNHTAAPLLSALVLGSCDATTLRSLLS